MPAAKTKKFTVSEFKTWLDGIMEFQESGWSPTAEQWNAIYTKIQNLKEPVQSNKPVIVDENSISEIVEELDRRIPDFSNLSQVDFAHITNVINAIAGQIRSGGTVVNPQMQQNSTPNAQPDTDSALANIPLSELRKREQDALGNGNSNATGEQVVLTEVEDEFV